MYRKYFAFTRLPLEHTLAPDELFPSSASAEAQARLKHLLEIQDIGLITGEGGAAQYLTHRLRLASCELPLFESPRRAGPSPSTTSRPPSRKSRHEKLPIPNHWSPHQVLAVLDFLEALHMLSGMPMKRHPRQPNSR